MLRIFALGSAISVGLIAGPACAADKTYDFQGFTEVSVASGIDVEIRVGEPFRVEADVSRARLLKRLIIERKGDRLEISRRSGHSFFMMGMADSFQVTVDMPALAAVSAASGAEVEVSGQVNGSAGRFKASASSGADLDVAGITVETLILSSSSGSELTARGGCGDVQISTSSGSDIEAKALTCTSANIRASSGSDVEIEVNGPVAGKVSSGAQVDVYGTPTVEELRESSGGDLNLRS